MTTRRKNAPHALDGVGVDDLLVRIPLLGVVAVEVDELHLLEHRRLARLSRTEQQHLDLVLRHLAVAFELVLDLVIACREGGGVSGGVGGP